MIVRRHIWNRPRSSPGPFYLGNYGTQAAAAGVAEPAERARTPRPAQAVSVPYFTGMERPPPFAGAGSW
jgi:hypothetical protein